MLEIEPDSPSGHFCLVSAYVYKGKYSEAVETIRQQMRKSGTKEEVIKSHTSGEAREVILAGHREYVNGMQEALAKRRKISATYLASVYADLGENDQAFAWLEKAFSAREPMFIFFQNPSRLRQPARRPTVRRSGPASESHTIVEEFKILPVKHYPLAVHP